MAKSTSLAGFANELEALDKNTVKTSEDVAAFNAVRSQLLAAFPEMASKLGGEVSSVEDLGGAYQETADAIWEMNEALEYQRWMEAHEKVGDASKVYKDSHYRKTSPYREDGLIVLYALQEAYLAAMNEETNEILQMAKTLGFAGESVDEFRGKMSAYIDDQYAIMGESAVSSPGWKAAKSNIGDAQTLTGMIEDYDKKAQYYYDEILPSIEAMEAEIGGKMQDSLLTIITNALNPQRYQNLPDGMLTQIIESLSSVSWGDATPDEIQAKAREFATNYYDEYAEALEIVDSVTNTPTNP